MRMLVFVLVLGVAGCAPDVTLKHPVTGATVTCDATPLADINLWSSYQLCLESAVSGGYQRVN